MIKKVNVYFYLNKGKLFIEKIVVYGNNKKRIFNYDENNSKDEEEKMYIILYKIICKLIRQEHYSLETLIDEGFINLKNVEAIELNNNLNEDDEKFLRNSVLLNILLFLGNIPGITGLVSYTTGMTWCLVNNTVYEQHFNENSKKTEKVSKKYDIDSKIFNLKRRKKIFNLCLAFSFVLGSFTMINKVKEYSDKISKIQIESSNPLTDENIVTLSKEEIKEYIIESIDKNCNLSLEDKEICKEICDYALDCEYLDYAELYRDLNTLKIIDKNEKCMEGNYSIVASYSDKYNLIIVYDEDYSREVSLQHEIIHSTGSFKSDFLNEGMTSLLQREYDISKSNDTDGYTKQVNTVRFLCELLGPDVVLEAYNKRDDNILYDAMAKIYGTRETAEDTLNMVSKIGTYVKYCENYNEIKEATINLITGLYKYIEAAENVDKPTLYYYIDSIIEENDANEIYYFNKEKNKTLTNKININ